ncbi:Type II secretion system protein F [Caloramator mitchellensis]|uniref:Type II secretion system protein F n=1 Tax=Caloramator mitchellensis TaxID=908809 RepID=A0A0R3JTJ5_CALMK|nr:type II secretion system F family protein [Caloramator mitchellensis]KRQ86855.1 Type II secretion system protein F [Caloramator mitchellensis]
MHTPLAMIKIKGDAGGVKGIRKFTNEETSVLFKQIHLISSSGVNIIKGIEIIKSMSEDDKVFKTLDLLSKQIIQGENLSDIFEKYNLIPSFAIYMMRVGERSGKLDKILLELADYYENEARIVKNIQQALTYPLILFITSVLVAMMLALKVIPNLISILHQLNIKELPYITKIIISMSSNIDILLIVLANFLFTIVILLKSKNPSIKKYLDSFLLKIPIYKTVEIKLLTSRIAKSLYIQISSGISILDSLILSEQLIKNYNIRLKYIKIIEEIKHGNSLGSTFKKYNLFPKIFTELISVGEETGNLEDTLNKLSIYFENDVEKRLIGIVKLMEPILIIFISIIIGVMVLAFLLPMFKIYNNLF